MIQQCHQATDSSASRDENVGAAANRTGRPLPFREPTRLCPVQTLGKTTTIDRGPLPIVAGARRRCCRMISAAPVQQIAGRSAVNPPAGEKARNLAGRYGFPDRRSMAMGRDGLAAGIRYGKSCAARTGQGAWAERRFAFDLTDAPRSPFEPARPEDPTVRPMRQVGNRLVGGAIEASLTLEAEV
jgi:hypothetical protein